MKASRDFIEDGKNKCRALTHRGNKKKDGPSTEEICTHDRVILNVLGNLQPTCHLLKYGRTTTAVKKQRVSISKKFMVTTMYNLLKR
jgi:hypothetical protein